ncbi:efflux RND transporter periplasmic adaptor subunit [Legionella brunensis]|uniref:Membrane fusion protein n=1 Tax=Legionella brunensis TaxID=29422 RepID=A0A0W0SMA4_9GAMM|nr:efflux RND transporter periplasmic adaptor subunit [Legionella brunensis]KTC84446.1 membrane fusion protein [Legionella brunensis]
MNRITLRLFSGLAFLTLIFLSASCEEKSSQTTIQPRAVKAIQISNVDSFNKRSFPGLARASQEVNLSFNVAGTLIKLPIKIGDKITKGSLIAQLDQKEFEAKLKSAKAELTRDKQNFDRAKELVKDGNISKSDYDLVKAKWEVSQANLDLAEKAMVDTIINAPFDGQIANLYVENYQTVAKQQVIARLLDTSQIEMTIQIPENAISLIPQVKNIMVQFDSFPTHNIPAEIKEISNEASPETRTYPVTIIMQQPKDIEILPGMAGKVSGQVEGKDSIKNKLTVPAEAVFTEDTNNKTYVWIVDNNKVHRRQITIGELTSTGISVLSGLTSDEWVVIAGIHSLKEGESVIILNQKAN